MSVQLLKKSILSADSSKCYICGSHEWIECHHLWGAANRKNSEKYGLVVPLCHYCHNEPPNGAHHNKKIMRILHEDGQRAFEKHHGTREEFMQIFGRNYL